jgi:hypothetical protein
MRGEREQFQEARLADVNEMAKWLRCEWLNPCVTQYSSRIGGPISP